MPFVENVGQIPNKDVAYYLPTFHGASYVDHDGAIYHRFPIVASSSWVLKEHLVGGNLVKPQVTASAAKVSYFLSSSASQRKPRAFAHLDWNNVYPGIDLSLNNTGWSLEKIFTVSPGASVSRIHIRVEGAEALSVTPDGRLLVVTDHGSVHFSRPVAFQEHNGGRRPVAVRYRARGLEYAFTAGPYDKTQPLVIDPLVAGTYLGSSDDDSVLRLAEDPASGDLLIAGSTSGADFPTTPGAYDTTLNNESDDIVVARMSSDLSTLKAATFLGGSTDESVVGIALDGSGNVYIAGSTYSSDFPTTAGVVKPSRSTYSDAIVAKLSPDLQSLLAATYLGDTGPDCASSGSDSAQAITVDRTGTVYITGITSSRTFPVTAGAYQTTISEGGLGFPCGQDAFVTILNSTLTSIVSSTYYGTGGRDNYTEAVESIAVDGAGNVYITGWAAHDTLPVTVAGADYSGGVSDIFIAKFNSDLTSLLAARYLGGGGRDNPGSAGLDATGTFFVAGQTTSHDLYPPVFPTTAGVWQETPPAGVIYDVGFATSLNPDLTIRASTFLDHALINAMDIEEQIAGSVLVFVGGGMQEPCPADAYDPLVDVYFTSRMFVGRFSSDLTTRLGATALRGKCGAYACAVLASGDGHVVVGGRVEEPDSIDLSPQAYNTTFNGGSSDLFLAKLTSDLAGNPNLRGTPSEGDFGTVTVPVEPGTEYPTLDITFDNPGTGWVQITSVSLKGSDASDFKIVTNGCEDDEAFLRPTAVLPDDHRSCTVQLLFQPFSVLTETMKAELQVESTDPDTPLLVVPLVGRTKNPELPGGTDGGCDCRTATSPLSGAFTWLLGAMMFWIAGRLRRRR